MRKYYVNDNPKRRKKKKIQPCRPMTNFYIVYRFFGGGCGGGKNQKNLNNRWCEVLYHYYEFCHFLDPSQLRNLHT